MAYQPGLRQGEPEKLILDPNASIGALLQEMQHFLDDQAAGYPGMRAWLEDPVRYWQMEERAYLREIQFAREHNDLEAARTLTEIMNRRRDEIVGGE